MYVCVLINHCIAMSIHNKKLFIIYYSHFVETAKGFSLLTCRSRKKEK